MRLRAAFLTDNPVCVRCLEADRVRPATVAHHVVERLADPRRALEMANLMALCASCHSKLHNARSLSGA